MGWTKKDLRHIRKFGFLTHAVTDLDNGSPTGVNYHTHGLEQFNHLNFQIVMRIPPGVAHSFFHILTKRIKNGERFESGSIVNDLIGNGMSVTFIKAKECDRYVLRVIFPDRKGDLDPETMEAPFAKQYKLGTYLEVIEPQFDGPVH